MPFFGLMLPGLDESPSEMLERLPTMGFALGSPILYYAGSSLSGVPIEGRLLRALWLILLLVASRRNRSEDGGSQAFSETVS